MANDPHSGWQVVPSSPGDRWFTITPNDVDDLPQVVRGIWVGSDGDVCLVNEQGDEAIFYGAKAGSIIPCRASKVKEADSTAGIKLVGIY